MVATQPENSGRAHLAKKMVAIMRQTAKLFKDQKNQNQGYQFISDEAVTTLLREALIENNVAVFTSNKSCTEIIQHDKSGNERTLTKLEVEYEIVDADSGESKVVTFFGYGTDSTDKGVYKASTGSEKYFLLKTWLIATYDDPEFEKTQREGREAFKGNKFSPPPAAPAHAAAAPQKPVAPPAGSTWPHPAEFAQAVNTAKKAEPTSGTPAGSPPAPARVSKYEQKTIYTFIKDVTKKNYGSGSSFFKINGVEGESWTTFSQTIAQTAKDLALEARQVQMVLDMQPKGPVVQSIQPVA